MALAPIVAARKPMLAVTAAAWMVMLVVATPAPATTLSEAPLSVAIPSTLTEGREAVVAFDARDAARAGIPFDVYVIRIPSRQPVLRYLTSTGTWTVAPTPWQRHRGVTAPTSQMAAWREEGPPGFVTLLVVFVRAGADPSDRSEWLFRPALGRVSVRPTTTTGTGHGVFAAALGLVTAATCALVVVMRPANRSGRPSTSACPGSA